MDAKYPTGEMQDWPAFLKPLTAAEIERIEGAAAALERNRPKPGVDMAKGPDKTVVGYIDGKPISREEFPWNGDLQKQAAQKLREKFGGPLSNLGPDPPYSWQEDWNKEFLSMTAKEALEKYYKAPTTAEYEEMLRINNAARLERERKERERGVTDAEMNRRNKSLPGYLTEYQRAILEESDRLTRDSQPAPKAPEPKKPVSLLDRIEFEALPDDRQWKSGNRSVLIRARLVIKAEATALTFPNYDLSRDRAMEKVKRDIAAQIYDFQVASKMRQSVRTISDYIEAPSAMIPMEVREALNHLHAVAYSLPLNGARSATDGIGKKKRIYDL